ncbi:hypothetical protein LEMLEM_LOCUS15930 [Lemmus lemmus]
MPHLGWQWDPLASDFFIPRLSWDYLRFGSFLWNTFESFLESFLFVAGRILRVLKQALQSSSQGLRNTQPATAGSTWGPVGNVLGPWVTCVVPCTGSQESALQSTAAKGHLFLPGSRHADIDGWHCSVLYSLESSHLSSVAAKPDKFFPGAEHSRSRAELSPVSADN